VGVLLAIAVAGPAPLLALDAKPESAVAPLVAPTVKNVQSPIQAFQAGTELLKSGENLKALFALQYAAEQGLPAAQWKLGRMYADGDGVKRDHVQAFQYFSRVASEQAHINHWTKQKRYFSTHNDTLRTY
jgi:hypothetical protein